MLVQNKCGPRGVGVAHDTVSYTTPVSIHLPVGGWTGVWVGVWLGGWVGGASNLIFKTTKSSTKSLSVRTSVSIMHVGQIMILVSKKNWVNKFEVPKRFGMLAGWLVGWLSDYIATSWPILQAEVS